MCELEKKAKTIFLSALEIDSESDREAFINGKCNDNQTLRREVQRLVDHWKGMGSFMESSPPDGTPSATAECSLDEKPGTLIGDYKLLQRLGEGGMGIVYLAERQHPVKQRVALKIIKHGMDTGQFLARFDAERQALAMMDHPNIAKVLDAGCTEYGRPYFVMELVKGISISTFCDENRLPTQARLELFLQVCQAVHHAHQKGIIHRDLKPSNILVALYDDQPVPKVIDFGVAKATNQHLTERTLFTAVGTIIGTWEYMSPEQAVLNQLDVDTRSDVYALGVLLYELLTGETPLDRQKLREGQLLETFRMIREEEPLKPSTRVSTLGDRATATAAYRRTKPELLASEIRGDLDWIVMKALAKERSRRYDSASRFATDIRRLLANDVVEARPPSLWYQAQKFYQRNKAAVGVVVAVFVALVIGLGGTLWNLNEVTKSRAELRQMLENWQQSLFRRALTAAFSGDETEVFKLIEKATEVNESAPDWEPKVRGLLDLFNGRLDNALDALKGAVEINDDPGAEALLACAYLQSGKQDEYMETRNRLEEIVFKETRNRSETIVFQPKWFELSVEDRLLVGHAIKFGNIIKGKKILGNILSEDPSPLALALHSQILMLQCYDRPNETRRALSLTELEAAQLMMPECAFLAVLEFWAYVPFEIGDEIPHDRREHVEDAVRELRNHKDYTAARHALACWADLDGRPDDARRHWDAVTGAIDSSDGGYIRDYYAAFEYRHGNIEKAERLLAGGSSESVLAAIHYGEMLALDPKRAEHARDMYTQALKAIERLSVGPDDVIGIPETILLLMGDEPRARRELKRRLHGMPASAQRQMMEFLADAEMSPKELLAAIGDASLAARAMAHKMIALRHLSRGEKQMAMEQLRACLSVTYWFPDSMWAHAILAQIEREDASPKQ